MVSSPPHAPESTLAARTAAANFVRNSAALGPWVASIVKDLTADTASLSWVFGRDGHLTAKTESGQSWSGTSLPRRLSHAMLKRLDIRGSTGCFLAPFHAAAIEAALHRLPPQQSLACIVPKRVDFAVILHCADFVESMRGGRLFFVAGDEWPGQLAALLEQTPGLATPTQFIKLPTLPVEIMESLVPVAQRVFADANTHRLAEIDRLRREIIVGSDEARICVIAPSRFRLWNDVGATLMGLFDRAETPVSSVPLKTVHFDPDRPAENSPLALARATRGCSAMLTANTSRGDLPGVLPDTVPWITWLTAGRIPPPPMTAVHDRLIVADSILRCAAIATGWTPAHVQVGTWPTQLFSDPPAEKSLCILADTCRLATPDDLENFSSHRLLWEQIRAELLSDPFSLPDDLYGFLKKRMTQSGIEPEGFDRPRFIDHLIVPAYQQGLARALLAAGFALRLYGTGWKSDPILAPHALGEVHTREAFRKAIELSSALVHVWPRRGVHPIEFVGRPIVRRTANKKETFLRDARLALAGLATPPREPEPAEPISAALIADLLQA